jgi:L,D-transpeptidase YcbB
VKTKVILAVLFAAVLSGCGLGTPDAEGWRSTQKDEFLEILETDKYASICNQQALYESVRENEDSKLMTKLLIAYTENLANGCIVDPSLPFEEKGKIKEGYGIYTQKVSASDIKMKLKAGQSIESILKPYVPEFNQFSCLIKAHERLKNDGNVSEATLRKIRLNIERVKLMKPGLGKNYALVNIPEFVVRIIEDEKTAVMMNVVVGKRKHKTPIFSEDLSYITLNPQWSVPDSIARNEVIPDLLKDPEYLKKNRMVMRSTYDLNSQKLSPETVDLNAYVGGKGYVPFKFIEVPSNKNALGRVKFIFPNQHSVYMHDTQAKSLFKRKVRAYSHGCVRLAKPSVMLDHISTHYTSTPSEEIQEKYDSMKTHYIKITKRLPVHTAYFTVYMDECNNLLQFGDIYRYDKLQKLNF